MRNTIRTGTVAALVEAYKGEWFKPHMSPLVIADALETAGVLAPDDLREEWGVLVTYLDRHDVEEWGLATREEAHAEAGRLLSQPDVNATALIRRRITGTEVVE